MVSAQLAQKIHAVVFARVRQDRDALCGVNRIHHGIDVGIIHLLVGDARFGIIELLKNLAEHLTRVAGVH